MMITTQILRAGLVIAAMAVAGLLAGCISDGGVNPVATSSAGNTQLRYYGGPKLPMWPAQ